MYIILQPNVTYISSQYYVVWKLLYYIKQAYDFTNLSVFKCKQVNLVCKKLNRGKLVLIQGFSFVYRNYNSYEKLWNLRWKFLASGFNVKNLAYMSSRWTCNYICDHKCVRMCVYLCLSDSRVHSFKTTRICINSTQMTWCNMWPSKKNINIVMYTRAFVDWTSQIT